MSSILILSEEKDYSYRNGQDILIAHLKSKPSEAASQFKDSFDAA